MYMLLSFGIQNSVLYVFSCFFLGPSRYRYALSTDVVVTKYTFIQFELAMGCGVEDNLCYGMTQ